MLFSINRLAIAFLFLMISSTYCDVADPGDSSLIDIPIDYDFIFPKDDNNQMISRKHLRILPVSNVIDYYNAPIYLLFVIKFLCYNLR